jgi:hypothetical protein
MPKIIGTKERTDRTYNPEDDVSTTENGTDTHEAEAEKTEEKRPPTITEVENHFNLQAQLIEAQLHDGNAYEHCPVCAYSRKAREEIMKLLRTSLSDLNEATEKDRLEGTTSHLVVYRRMIDELPWIGLASSITAAMMQAGHQPNKIMNQHPDLIVTKHERRAAKSGKHKRQLAREARRHNRG